MLWLDHQFIPPCAPCSDKLYYTFCTMWHPFSGFQTLTLTVDWPSASWQLPPNYPLNLLHTQGEILQALKVWSLWDGKTPIKRETLERIHCQSLSPSLSLLLFLFFFSFLRGSCAFFQDFYMVTKETEQRRVERLDGYWMRLGHLFQTRIDRRLGHWRSGQAIFHAASSWLPKSLPKAANSPLIPCQLIHLHQGDFKCLSL